MVNRRSDTDLGNTEFFFEFFMHTTHTTKAERMAERITLAPQAPACGQKTKCCIEGERPGRRRY